MTLTINLPPATIEKLEAQAAAKGQDVETFVREALEVKLAISGRSFREIMSPVHEEFRKSGMSEQELNSLVDEAVAEARAERKASRKQP
jgi:plasmid stability protein